MSERTAQAELLPRAAGATPRAQVPAASTLTLRTLDLELPGGRLLRLALSFDADGHPEDLVIACGFPGRRLLDLSEGVNLPAGSLPALRDALAELAR